MFDKLNESTMRGWFVPDGDGRTFKENVILTIDSLEVDGGRPTNLRSIALGQRPSLWKGKPNLEDE